MYDVEISAPKKPMDAFVGWTEMWIFLGRWMGIFPYEPKDHQRIVDLETCGSAVASHGS